MPNKVYLYLCDVVYALVSVVCMYVCLYAWRFLQLYVVSYQCPVPLMAILSGDVGVRISGGVGNHERLLSAEFVRAHHPRVLPVLDASLDRKRPGHRRAQLDGAIRIPALGYIPQPMAGAGYEQVPAGGRAWGGPLLGAGGDSRRGK